MEETQIIIIGCGPTGALLSAYLGRQNVKNIVLEKDADITTDPRGIALDEDGIRAVQGLGLYGRLWKEIGMPMSVFNFVPPGKEQKCDMHAKPFLRSDIACLGPVGHPAMMAHKQPALEKGIRDVMAGYPSCELRSACKVVSISEDDEFVYVTYEDRNGVKSDLKGKFLVGADGKTGFTRKMYLEPRGIKLEKVAKMLYEETWVALNLRFTLPTPETHPDFALFKELSYSPEQVYDAFFPDQFRFFCNPERPAVCGRFGLKGDRLWRFEFVVEKGEDGKEMAKWENVWRIVGPYLKHSGRRYGLKEDVAFPKDCIELLRSSPFNFSARSCNKWALGRVILCGDSAHVFPPFGGQGIASGFRDALSLSWRLPLAVRSNPPPHTPLLEAWYLERKQQLELSLAVTVANGSVCTERNPVKIFVRDWLIWILSFIPAGRRWMEPKRGLAMYRWAPGMPFVPQLGGGKCFPQVFCTSLGEVGSVKPKFTDDVIFARPKTSLFQLVVLLDSPEDFDGTLEELQNAKHQLSNELQLDEATCIITQPLQRSLGESNRGWLSEGAVRVLFKDEFTPDILDDFPGSEGYDGHVLRSEIKGKYVVLRPDRFIFADCIGIKELGEASKALTEMLHGQDGAPSKF